MQTEHMFVIESCMRIKGEVVTVISVFAGTPVSSQRSKASSGRPRRF